MHFRKLTLVVGLIGAFVANGALALGLGEITLKSALDEPLDAEIRLLQVRDLTPEEILIRLASADDFRRVGVERVFFLQELTFDVQLNAPGGPIVRVTSERPVREPYVNFLVEAVWPNGRLLREYTVLLDLPVFTAQPSRPVQGVQTQPAPQPAPQAQPAAPRQAAATPQPAPQPVRPQPQAEPAQPEPQPEPQPQSEPQPQPTLAQRPSTEVYGPVQANDTLWEIALRIRPNRDVSVQQTMLALQRLNPDAFINDNINLLKRGQILRIPDLADIQQLSQREAVAEVAYQNNAWSGSRDGGPVAGAELEAARVRPTERPVEQAPRGQVTLAAPGDAASAAGRSGAAEAGADTEALENELAISLEELDASRRENEELSTRVAELEEQIETMERLIEVSNEELRNLQQAAEQQGQAATEPASEPAPVLTEQSPTQSEAEPETSTPAVAATPQPQSQPVEVSAPRSRDASLMDMLFDYIWYILGGVLVLAGGLIYVLHRRSQAEMEAFDSFDEDEFYDDDDQSRAESEPDFDEQIDENDHYDLAADIDEPEQQDESIELPTESETGDAVGEADIYIAYGKYDQAEEMLQRAIAKEPGNVEARLKLLEVYSETKEIEKFDGAYSKLLALDDASANRRAAELRNLIPGAAPFAAAAAVPAHGDAEADTDGESFDLDLDQTLSMELDNTLTEAKADSGLDLGDLDFDLDGDESSSAASEGRVSEESYGNFSLDDDSIASESAADELTLESGFDSANATSGELEFDLDFADGDEAEALAGDDALDLSLDLNEDTESTLDDGELSLDLDESSELDAAFDEAMADGGATETSDDDILADLEFSAASLDDDEEASAETPTTTRVTDGGDDDFDLDLGDLDLEALDQEMDALVGDLDDLDESDPPATPTDVMPALAIDDVDGDDDFDLDLDTATADFGSALASRVPATEAAPAASRAEPEFSFDSDMEDDGGLAGDMDSELDFLSDTDEVATKLDLARAYMDMGDKDGARDILDEVAQEGNDSQKQEAKELLGKL